jgi:hypothetical protein
MLVLKLFVKAKTFGRDTLALKAIEAYEFHRVKARVTNRLGPPNHFEKVGRACRPVANDNLDDSQ